MLHRRTVLCAIVIAGTSAMLAMPGLAQSTATGNMAGNNQSGKLKGLWLTTGFPSRSAEMGNSISIDLDLQNKALPPQRVEMSVDGVPSGWKSEFVGDGSDVSAAMVNTDDSKDLSLKLTPPKDAKGGTYDFKIVGKAADETLTLPIDLKLTAPKAAKLELTPKLPDLQGTAKTAFSYEADLKNDSLKDTVVNLSAQAPDGFQVTFTQGYDSQQIASLPLKAGESKTIKASVTPPDDTAAGKYKVLLAAQSSVASATAPVELSITGAPKIGLVGPNGRLSGSATAGKERDFTFTVVNSGSKAAQNVKVAATPPDGWKVESEPKTIPSIAPNGKQTVSLHVTPSGKAVAGDYMLDVSANGKGASDDEQFRVTVETSTLWGATGLGVIAAALIVMAVGVRRYGRR